MKKSRLDFVTDTATLCVFDVVSLQHRLKDDCDWWVDPAEELIEVNAGNAAFIGLGSDGKYSLELKDREPEQEKRADFLLKCPSGRVFIGAGEEVTSEDMEPEAFRGGGFINVEPGTYELRVWRIGEYELALHLLRSTESAHISIKTPVRI